MKKNRPIKTIVAAASLALVILAMAILAANPATEAAGSILGVEDIVAGKVESGIPYRILEVVPNTGTGELGFLVEGSEPLYLTDRLDQWIAEQSAMEGWKNTSEVRKDYVAQLLSDLGTFTQVDENGSNGNNNSRPLYYQDYQEKYFLSTTDNTADWKRLIFPKGSYEVQSISGNYQYKESGDYTPVIEHFDLNTTSDQRHYKVTFQRYNEMAGVIDQYGLGYYISEEGDYSFKTKETGEFEPGVVYYVVTGYEYCEDSNTAGCNYIAVLNSELSYRYTPGKGSFEFSPVSDQASSVPGTTQKVELGQVYIRGGFTNNNWFKTKIIDTATGDNLYNLEIKVDSLEVSELATLTQDKLNAYDMVYLAKDFYDQTTYAGNNELPEAVVENLANRIFGTSTQASYMPFIADIRIFNEIAQQVTPGSDYSAVEKNGVYQLLLISMYSKPNGIIGTPLVETVANVDWLRLYDTASTSPKKGATSVDHNLYFIKEPLVSETLTQDFSDGQITSGFTEIRDWITSENLLREKDDEKIPTNISKAVAVQYIINYQNGREIVSKTTLKILEIQPCYSFDFMVVDTDGDNKKETKQTKLNEFLSTTGLTYNTQSKTFLGTETSKYNTVTVDGMTTAEFIGKIDDINTKYDIVYIGMNTGRLNTRTVGNIDVVNRNASDMDYFVYTHSGDTRQVHRYLGGILNSEYTNYTHEYLINANMTVRYSGNDITQEKKNALIDFANARYAVVLDDDFYSTNGEGGTIVNTKLVDNTSWIYKFVNETLDDTYPNVFGYTEATTTSAQSFAHYVNMPKLSLEFTGTPGVVQLGTQEYQLYYNFQIKSSVETSYRTPYVANLYIDMNSDGRYSTLEWIQDIQILDEYGREVPVDSSTNRVNLYTNTTYQVSRVLPSGTTGVVAWNLEVAQAANPMLRTSVTYADHEIQEIPAPSAVTIRVLQINQHSGATSHWNMEDDARNGTLKTLLEDPALKSYNIQITTKSSDAYVWSFQEDARKGENYLDNYDMIIIGFADVYEEISNASGDGNQLENEIGPVDAILKFINDGKSTLFTHDTTSFTNYNNETEWRGITGDAWWGYNFNTILRNVVGMDRYGVSGTDKLATALRAGTVKYVQEVTSPNGNVRYKCMDANGIEIDTTDKDVAYIVNRYEKDRIKGYNSAVTAVYPQVQGYSDNLVTFKGADSKELSPIKYTQELGRTEKYHVGTSGQYAGQMMVNQVNKGQITSYPFAIDETFQVSNTHYQYYQLDLESDIDDDGMGDVVVWYCIGDVEKDRESIENIYRASPNDVRNNYYIYSKGNVMYSGIGHSKVDQTMEKKLFVNTMIAAYKTGVRSPIVECLNGPSITSGVKTNEYMFFDDAMAMPQEDGTLTGGNLDDDLKLYYTVNDPNLVSTNRVMEVKYYISDPDGAATICDGTVRATELTGITKQVIGSEEKEVASNALVSGGVYTIDIPDYYSYLTKSNNVQLYVEVNNKFKYYGKQVEQVGYGILNTSKAGIFDLN